MSLNVGGQSVVKNWQMFSLLANSALPCFPLFVMFSKTKYIFFDEFDKSLWRIVSSLKWAKDCRRKLFLMLFDYAGYLYKTGEMRDRYDSPKKILSSYDPLSLAQGIL